MQSELLESLSGLTEEEKNLLNGAALNQESYTQGAAFVFSGRKLLPPSRMITLRPHTRFAAFPVHSHDYVEMLYMLSGQTTHELPGYGTLTLREGELLMMNRQALHGIQRCGQNDIGVNFIVQPAFFDEALDAVGVSNTLGRFLMESLGRGESTVPYLHFRVAELPAVQSLLESMIASLVSEVPVRQRILKMSMTLLMLYLLEHSSKLSLPEKSGSALVVAVLEEIQHHYANISFAQLAKERHVSAAYLSQTVRRATGESCTKLLQQRRMEQAKRLLRDTTLAVVEVAAAVGYANTAYFYRVFTATQGMGPSEYRKQHVKR